MEHIRQHTRVDIILDAEFSVHTEVVRHVKQDVTGATLRSVKFAIGGAPETESFWSIVLTFSYK